MGRKNKYTDPKYTLSQDEADRLAAELKNAVDSFFRMPAGGEQKARFHVRADDGDDFSIHVFRGRIDPDRHIAAVVTRCHTPLLRLCVNGRPHTNPDGSKAGRTHWHVYKEGEDDWNAYPADIDSPDFVNDTILLLDKFNVIRKPAFQGEML